MPELPDEDPEPLSPSVESVTSPPPASAPAPSVTQPPPVAAPAPSREVVPTVSSPVPAGDGSHQCYLCPECASVDKEIIALLREEVNDLTNEVRQPATPSLLQPILLTNLVRDCSQVPVPPRKRG